MIVAMVALSTLQTLEGTLEPELYLLLTSIFGALAGYFRANPRVDFVAGQRSVVSRKKK